MFKKINNWLFIFAVLLLLLKFGNWAVKRGHPLPAQPQPNGYTELLAAAAQVKDPGSDPTEFSMAQIRSLAGQDHAALEAARQALLRDSRVSLQPTKQWDDRHEGELKSLKRLGLALTLEARVQQLDQHTNEAARCDLDLLHLSQATCRGGIIVDSIAGLTMEAIGTLSLQAKLPYLDAAFCRAAALDLEGLNARRETPETTLAIEKTWFGARYGLVNILGGVYMRKSIAEREAKFRSHARDATRRSQHLMLRLAVRAYELDNHRTPASVAELVPGYLKAVPRDAETGKEIQELPAPLS